METDDLLQKAKFHQQKLEFKEAIACYKQLLDIDPNQADIQHLLGILLVHTQQYDLALQHINQAISLKPEVSTFYNSKGNLLTRLKQYSAAIEVYERAIQLHPDYSLAYTNLGNCYLQQQEYALAKQYYELAIQVDDQAFDAYFNYGRLAAELGETEQAISLLQKALTIQPQHPRTLGQLGQIYLQQKDYRKSTAYFRERLSLEPQHIDTHHSLGLSLFHRHKFSEAISAFHVVIKMEPHYPEINYHIALTYLMLDDQKNALKYFLKQIEEKPHLESYFNIGIILMYREQHRDAIGYLEKALHLNPNYLEAHLNIAAIELKCNHIDEAITHYQAALKLSPNNQEILYLLAALQQNAAPSQAPTLYLEHLFDQYANYYDAHLLNHLDYQVPKLLFAAIESETEFKSLSWRILDLGCGTGLCGELFKKMASELIGIDISRKMLALALQKKIYNQTHQGDLQTWLPRFKEIDLIVAADVFTYIGDLGNIFKQCHHALKEHGLFAFSVEKADVNQDFVLQTTARYAHSRKYLQRLIDEHKFVVLEWNNIILRKQKKKPVAGFLLVLKK